MSENTNTLNWDFYNNLSTDEKRNFISQLPHTLISQQFKRSQIDELCKLSSKIRSISKTKKGADFLKSILSDKRAMLYFAQPSSRTYLSFNAACQILGLDTMDVRDSKTSSEIKGETPEDTVRTFSSYVDLIIMRHPEGGFAEKVAIMLSSTNREIPVINAGSGADQHPTQALLDIYTLERSFEDKGGIDNKTILFSGDLKRGRTVRSLSLLLTLYDNINIIFSAPKELQIKPDILKLLDKANVNYFLTEEFNDYLSKTDAVYMTRLQDEWDIEDDSQKIDRKHFQLDHTNLAKLKKDAIIMHPLPRREEISTSIDNSPKAMYWRQMRNGMWIRAALILKTFGRENYIYDWENI